jgi:uncharacterized repeat protein (TIGR01451 family)
MGRCDGRRPGRSKRRGVRPRGSRAYRAGVEHLDARWVPAFIVDSPLDVGDFDLTDGVPRTQDGQVTLKAIREQAFYDGTSSIAISFASPMTIPGSYGFDFCSVKIDATGVTFSSDEAFGDGSEITGGMWRRGFSAGASSTIQGVQSGPGDGDVSAGGNSTITDSQFGGDLATGGESLVIGCTVGGNLYAGGGAFGSQVEAAGGAFLGDGATLEGGRIWGGVQFANDVTLSGVTVGGALSVIGSRNTIEDCTLRDLSINGGTSGDQATGNRVTGNRIGPGIQGVQLTSVTRLRFENNVVVGQELRGVQLDNSFVNAPGMNVFVGNRIGIDESGNVMPNGSGGLVLVGSSDDQIGGPGASDGNIIVGNKGSGISITNSPRTKVQNNAIGTDFNGRTGIGNLFDGITISQGEGEADITIGGAAGQGNVIAGNARAGIRISASKVVVRGNRIGRATAGDDVGLGNGEAGIEVVGDDNSIGGANSGEGNIVGGNVRGLATGAAVRITGDRNKVEGNRIGTDRPGVADIGNRGGGGISIIGESNTVGGAADGAANIIAFNGFDVAPISGYGVLIGGTADSRKNTVSRNSIFGNNGRAIRMRRIQDTLNDVGMLTSNSSGQHFSPEKPDEDEGPNGLQNFPTFEQIDFDTGAVKGNLKSTPNKTFTIEFFESDSPHKSGFGDAQKFLSSIQVTTNEHGYAEFETTLPLQFGRVLSATATDSEGNTSAISMVDSDTDGVPDAWETTGIDLNEDGTIDLQLPGGNARRKTIYVEVDYMGGTELHTDARTGKTSFDLVRDSFFNAPVKNIDGTTGIDLRVQVGESGIRSITIPADLGDGFKSLKDEYFGTPAERANPLAVAAKKLVYRYCVVANEIENGWTGRAELPGNDFAIKDFTQDGNPYAAIWDAGNFMHELGHTLGLHHGGGGSDEHGYGDEINNKINYLSVMNYLWLFPGADSWAFATGFGIEPEDKLEILNRIYNGDPFKGTTLAEFAKHMQDWRLDYSRSALPTLSEAFLLELTGIGGDENILAMVAPSYKPGVPRDQQRPQFVPMGGAVDWNQSNLPGDWLLPVARNLNDLAIDGRFGGGLEVFVGREDWSQLRYNFLDSSFGYSSSAFAPDADELPPLLIEDEPATTPSPTTTADLAATSTVSTSQAAVGDSVVFTIVVRNDGPDAATGVVLTDALPAGASFVSASLSQGTFAVSGGVLTATLGSLAPGASATIQIHVTANLEGELVNTAAVATSSNDPDPSNDQTTPTVVVLASNPPIDPGDPTTPVDPGDPTTPVDPGNPSQPVDPVGPSQPVGPASPSPQVGLVRLATIPVGRRRRVVIVVSLTEPLGAASKLPRGAIRLFLAGRDQKLGTRDDRAVPIRAATYDAKANTILVRPAVPPRLLRPGLLVLRADALRDPAGRSIDGDKDGAPGGDARAYLLRYGTFF